MKPTLAMDEKSSNVTVVMQQPEKNHVSSYICNSLTNYFIHLFIYQFIYSFILFFKRERIHNSHLLLAPSLSLSLERLSQIKTN